LDKKIDLSITEHVAIVCFIGAAHLTMLDWLSAAGQDDASKLLSYWHELMESPEKPESRKQFFKEVVQRANSASHFSFFWRQALIF
jgi:hypothetical protein